MLVGFTFGAIWEDPADGFIKFAVHRDLKQDQTLHMEGETSRYSLLQGGGLKSKFLENFLNGVTPKEV